MADSKSPKESSPNKDNTKTKRAGESTAACNVKTPKSELKSSKRNNLTPKPDDVRSRPQSATKNAPRPRSASADSGNRTSMSIEERQEKVKQQREKQVEERKRKNEERRLAFEERRKQKQDEEKEKWEQLKQMAAVHRPGSGRKLPTLPDPPKRLSNAGMSQSRPSALPKSLKTPSNTKSPDKTHLGNRARSSSSLSSDSSSGQSPTNQPKNLLRASRTGSSGNINDNRRASTSNLYRPSSSSGRRPSSLHADDPKLKPAKSQSSLAPRGKFGGQRAQSTSALNRIDLAKPTHSPKKQPQKQEKPKAGLLDEAAAKQALAERRKQAREEAERKAKLDLERQEEERKKKEEEERKLAEEEAKEEERMRQLADMLKQQEEERLQKAIAEKEEKDKEEAARLAEEERQREEERKIKEEEERIAKIEAEKKANENEERRKQEELERQERRKRVEEIMARTRQAKTGPAQPETNVESKPEVQEGKDSEDDTKRKVSQLLQKVKDRTEGQENAPVLLEDSPNDCNESLPTGIENIPSIENTSTTNNETVEKENIASNEHTSTESTQILHQPEDTTKPIQEVSSVSSIGNSVVRVHARVTETRTEFNLNENGNRTLNDYGEESSINDSHVSNNSVNGHNRQEHNDVGQAITHSQITNDEDVLWKKTETLMLKTENSTAERLENAGIVAEGENDPDSGEAKLWKVIEGPGLALADVA